MGTTIRIDDDVYEALKNKAEPFVDTPNTVLRRLLKLEDVSQDQTGTSNKVRTASSPAKGQVKKRRPRKPKRTRVSSEDLLPFEDYYKPILRAVNDAGGEYTAKDAIEAVGREMADKFTEVDKTETSSGQLRWKNRTQFARGELIARGFLADNAPRGVWQITDTGREFLEGGIAEEGAL